MVPAPPGPGSDDGTLRRRRLVAVPLVVLALVVLAYYAGVVGRPTAGIADRGDWGTVTDERTEIVTTVWVNNPNPFGATFGEGLAADWAVRLNDVRVASGSRTGMAVPPGNTTVHLESQLRNDRLADWWVAFLRANETLRVAIDGTIRIDVGPTVTHTVEENRTMLAEERPVRDAVAAVGDRMQGTYTRTVTGGEDVGDTLEAIGVERTEVTVGYEIERVTGTLDVTRNTTTIRYRIRVRNPGDVPVVVSDRGIRVVVAFNDVRMFRSNGTALAAADVTAEDVLAPGETRELWVNVSMDNDRVDDWFTSHVRNGERSTVSARFRLLVEHPLTGETLRFPSGEPVTYDCSFRTAILVDDQEPETTCGNLSRG